MIEASQIGHNYDLRCSHLAPQNLRRGEYSQEGEPVARAPLQPEGNVQKHSEQEIQAKLKEEMGVSWVKEKLILLLECLLCL